MKKVMKFFGIEVHASSKAINGKKSSGREELSGGYSHWRACSGGYNEQVA